MGNSSSIIYYVCDPPTLFLTEPQVVSYARMRGPRPAPTSALSRPIIRALPEISFPTFEKPQFGKTTQADRSSFSFRYLDLVISYKFRIIFAFPQNPEHLIIMHSALLLVASLTVLLSSASGSPLPEPQPQPLFFRQLGNILQKKIGIIRNILGAVAR